MKHMNTIITALFLTMAISGMLFGIALVLGGVYKKGYDKGVQDSPIVYQHNSQDGRRMCRTLNEKINSFQECLEEFNGIKN